MKEKFDPKRSHGGEIYRRSVIHVEMDKAQRRLENVQSLLESEKDKRKTALLEAERIYLLRVMNMISSDQEAEMINNLVGSLPADVRSWVETSSNDPNSTRLREVKGRVIDWRTGQIRIREG